MCESGGWASFEELENSLSLDELMLLYETTIERQKRLIETVGAAFGATGGGSESHSSSPVTSSIQAEGVSLFGYESLDS